MVRPSSELPTLQWRLHNSVASLHRRRHTSRLQLSEPRLGRCCSLRKGASAVRCFAAAAMGCEGTREPGEPASRGAAASIFAGAMPKAETGALAFIQVMLGPIEACSCMTPAADSYPDDPVLPSD